MTPRQIQRAMEAADRANKRRQSVSAVLIVIAMAFAVAVAAYFILGPEQLNELLGTHFPTRRR